MRSKIKAYNNELKNHNFADEDATIINKVTTTKQYKNCNTILLYYPMKNEVDTILLIKKSLVDKKRVCLPKIINHTMVFIPLDDNWKSNLIKNSYNIEEPISDDYITDFNNCLMIVPNLGLGKDLTRIGHGKGYYDIFLEDKENIFKLGICRKHVLFDSLPTEKDDILLDRVISSI